MRITFIANPHAGRGRTLAFLARYRDRLGGEADVLWTDAPGHATELARRAREHSDVVCAVGGDGTVHEVVNGLMPDPVPLVVIPLGSGNDFAGMFDFPRTPEDFTRVVAEGMGLHVDVIECGPHYCVNSIGLGFEALVTRKSLSIRALRGLPLYVTAAVRAMISYDCPPMTIRFPDGEVISGERLMVSICNGVRAGGGFRLAPDALPDDGEIDLCIVDRMTRRRLLQLLPSAVAGRHTGADGVIMRRSSEVTIEAQRPFHAHIDGEYQGELAGPFHVRTLHRRLPIVCGPNTAVSTAEPIRKVL
jgi:YegS/Rv2252/BmrU family lipid kinase